MTITVGELVSFGPQDLGNEGRWSMGTQIFCTRLCVNSKGIFAAEPGGPPPPEGESDVGTRVAANPRNKEEGDACAGVRPAAR